MRPRPDAAENRRKAIPRVPRRRRFNEAAARCRGKRRSVRTTGRKSGSFNEAAARCRGKLVDRLPAQLGRPLASMRPRPDAAENDKTSIEWTDSPWLQ